MVEQLSVFKRFFLLNTKRKLAGQFVPQQVVRLQPEKAKKIHTNTS